MRVFGIVVGGLLLAMQATQSHAADDILDAIDQARKAYQANDLSAAKQQIDTASQLIAQRNAEAFSKLLPGPLPGWKAEQAQTQAMGAAMFGGASSASRSYTNSNDDRVEITITGDSALLMQFTPLLNNPAMAGAMGKLVKVSGLNAIQNQDGDVMFVVANKYFVNVQGSADAAAKIAYANAMDVKKLSSM